MEFFRYTIAQPLTFVVNDTLADPRFRDLCLNSDGTSLVRFYAGFPIRLGKENLGCLYIIDTKPRPGLTQRELSVLQDLVLIANDILVERRKRINEFEVENTNMALCLMNNLRHPLEVVTQSVKKVRKTITSSSLSLRPVLNGKSSPKSKQENNSPNKHSIISDIAKDLEKLKSTLNLLNKMVDYSLHANLKHCCISQSSNEHDVICVNLIQPFLEKHAKELASEFNIEASEIALNLHSKSVFQKIYMMPSLLWILLYTIISLESRYWYKMRVVINSAPDKLSNSEPMVLLSFLFEESCDRIKFQPKNNVSLESVMKTFGCSLLKTISLEEKTVRQFDRPEDVSNNFKQYQILVPCRYIERLPSSRFTTSITFASALVLKKQRMQSKSKLNESLPLAKSLKIKPGCMQKEILKEKPRKFSFSDEWSDYRRYRPKKNWFQIFIESIPFVNCRNPKIYYQ